MSDKKHFIEGNYHKIENNNADENDERLLFLDDKIKSYEDDIEDVKNGKSLPWLEKDGEKMQTIIDMCRIRISYLKETKRIIQTFPDSHLPKFLQKEIFGEKYLKNSDKKS